MESAPRTTVPAGPDASTNAPPPPRRGWIGLPARLAILTLLATVVCVVGIAVYADHRIQQSMQDQAAAFAVEVAKGVSVDVGAPDADPADDALNERLGASFKQTIDTDEGINAIAVLGREVDGTLKTQVATDGADASTLRAVAREALRSSRPETRITGGGDRVVAAWPMIFADGEIGRVVVVDVEPGAVAAAAEQSRKRLLLGAILGGALLGVMLLLLLRHELFRPLEEMRRVMGQIRGGARGVRIGWTRTDELGAVADEFDAMVSELEEAQAELAKYVHTDPLTGLLTREAFTDRFSGELTRARREGYPIALLAIDVDELDELNRTHDEAAGDQVLGTIGDVVRGCTRPTDACGRTGGDSFHVALVGADVSRAAVVVQRIRAEIAQRVGVGPERTRVTCSYGLAEFPTNAVDQIALERMADSACELAHRQGRDHAIAFGPAGGHVDASTLVPEEERSGERPAGQEELSSTVHALARSLDGIDPALGGGAHSQRVARYAAALARDLDLPDAQMRELRSAAVLHDVGKVAVPPSVLRQPADQLDERQRGVLQYHAWVSRTMIAGAGLAQVAELVFHMPERWDGTGYPKALRDEAIPLGSRILHAAELLDQISFGVAGMQPFAVASELKRRAGNELDPELAVRLARMVREEGLLGSPAASDVADAA